MRGSDHPWRLLFLDAERAHRVGEITYHDAGLVTLEHERLRTPRRISPDASRAIQRLG